MHVDDFTAEIHGSIRKPEVGNILYCIYRTCTVFIFPSLDGKITLMLLMTKYCENKIKLCTLTW